MKLYKHHLISPLSAQLSSSLTNCFEYCFIIFVLIKITIKANQIDMDVLLISNVDNIKKPCLSPKCGFFHYFIGLRILSSRTNIVPKIYRDLSALEGIILTSYLWLFLLRMICLPTACHLVNLQARFSKVEN